VTKNIPFKVRVDKKNTWKSYPEALYVRNDLKRKNNIFDFYVTLQVIKKKQIPLVKTRSLAIIIFFLRFC